MPDPGRAGPARTGFLDAATGIFGLLALALALRLIIAYLIPGSGFGVDLASFQYWASNLASEGLQGFYQRDFFHDYTPGYLYVLWLVGGVANLFGGGVGDLIKLPPIAADLALGYLVWSMVRELGGSERSARVGAALVLFNPVTWFDSVVWGQVDSFGVVFLLLALRELWRDRPERASILATVAALIKPQLGILIPILVVVVIRRALWPKVRARLASRAPAEGATEAAGTTAWERRVRGPIRIVTSGAAAILTAFLACLPFGLDFPFGLVAQIFKTAGGYPYLSVNAFNPWAVFIHRTADGAEQSIALTRTWVCDSQILASQASEFRIGPFVIPQLSTPGSGTDMCPDGAMVGAFPALYVGMALFLLAAVLVCWMVARRPEPITITVGLAILALAFFVLPTRVHERYLFPFVAIAAILAAASLRWRVAYVLSALATFANLYVVLAIYYPDNPQISDWLGFGDALAAPWGVAIAAATQAAVLGWAFFQLREGAVEGIAHRLATVGHRPEAEALAAADAPDLDRAPERGFGPAGRLLPRNDVGLPGGATVATMTTSSSRAARPTTDGVTTAAISSAAAFSADAAPIPADALVLPAWSTPDTVPLGPIAWFRARLADPPIRADRSRELNTERGGRIDRLDIWILALLAISLLTVRMWRLDEPYSMHFDEVYHARTATEFLQDWRYGLPHRIYEWTHPHLAKYAMAFGLVAFGEDRVSETGQLNAAVTAAVIENRRDDGLDETRVQGDRLWVATGSEVRAYDLATRELAATAAVPDAVALAYDKSGRLLYIGTRGGEIRIVQTDELDAARGRGVQLADARPFMMVDPGLERLFLSRDGQRLLALLRPGSGTTDPLATPVVVLDAGAASEMTRFELRGVRQIGDSIEGRIYAATDDGLAVIDPVSGELDQIVDVGGAVQGVVGISDIQDDPIFVSVATPEGPRVKTLVAKAGEDPRITQTLTLPGDTAGRAFFDVASRMVHVEGTTPSKTGGLGSTGPAGVPTIYVLEPHGDPPTVYADARLPFAPAAIVLDDNQNYPASDRQQLIALDGGGQIASVPIGRHAYAWRVPGVLAGVLMAVFLYVLARLLFRRRSVAVLLGLIVLADGMLFVQSRIGMNDSYVGLGIVGAYTIFAALWLRPGETWRHWLAFAVGIPIVGFFLGFALASKWVAAFAIGGLGLLSLSRSALGRLLLIAGLVLLTTVLGYIAISVPEGGSGGNYLFFGIMVALLLIAVIANVVHPIAWSWDETRFAIGVPAALGGLAILYGLWRGDAAGPVEIGPLSATPIELGFLGIAAAAAVWAAFLGAGRLGFGPLAPTPLPEDAAAVLDPPAEPARGWLRLGAGFGLPAVWLGICLLVIPIGLYVVSYIPWAFVDNYQIVEGWPPGHDNGQTLLDLTGAMYGYHNNLPNPHPASSPWWAWLLDLKPVWFYEQGFAGSTSASIYDAGNLVAWWLAIPAMAFVAWQAFRRRSPALALVAIGFAAQWLQWARIDRAAFQYHYYTALPFLFIALAYFLAELWHGTSRRIWLLARLSAGAAVLGPFILWLLHRPLCAVVRVTDVNPGSQACPTLIPAVTITPHAIALAIVMGVGVLLLLRELLAVTEEDEPAELEDERAAGGLRGTLARIGLGGRWAASAVIAVGTAGALLLVNTFLQGSEGFDIEGIPVEPIALIVLLALSPVAAYVATARDARRFVVGALGAMGFWFVLWYPNIAALPLPTDIHNAYQGFLPTYLYPFQFSVSNSGASAPALFALGPAIMLAALVFMSVVVAYSAWSWRVAIAERKRDALAAPEPPPWGADAG